MPQHGQARRLEALTRGLITGGAGRGGAHGSAAGYRGRHQEHAMASGARAACYVRRVHVQVPRIRQPRARVCVCECTCSRGRAAGRTCPRYLGERQGAGGRGTLAAHWRKRRKHTRGPACCCGCDTPLPLPGPRPHRGKANSSGEVVATHQGPTDRPGDRPTSPGHGGSGMLINLPGLSSRITYGCVCRV